MSGADNETPKRTTRSRAGETSDAAAPATPGQEPSPPPAPAAPGGGATASQATAAVSNALSIVRQRLQLGEQLVLVGSALIAVVVYVLFEFLLDYRVVSHFTVLVAVLAILAIWVHRWGHYDFGNGYRIVIGALGISLALFAVLSLLAWARAGGVGGDFLRLIGLVIYWVSGIVAGYGAWLVFRTR